MAKEKPPRGATLWLKDGWIHVRTPFSREFVDELKKKLSRAHRRWSPEEKVWMVDPSQDDLIVEIVTKYFGEPTVLENKEVVVVAGSEEDVYGQLLRLAPDDVLKKVYRLIATSLHPDKGGSAQAMTHANQAWGAIKKDRGL